MEEEEDQWQIFLLIVDREDDRIGSHNISSKSNLSKSLPTNI